MASVYLDLPIVSGGGGGGGAASVPDATTSAKGKIQIATTAEAIAGTENTKALTSLGAQQSAMINALIFG